MKEILKFALLALVIAQTAVTELPEEENDLVKEAGSIVACGKCR